MSLYAPPPGLGSGSRNDYNRELFSTRDDKRLSANVFGYTAAAETPGIHGMVQAQPVRRGTQPAPQANGAADIVKALAPLAGSVLQRFAGQALSPYSSSINLRSVAGSGFNPSQTAFSSSVGTSFNQPWTFPASSPLPGG